MLDKMNRQIGPIIGALLGLALLQSAAFGQDAAWEGLINAGRNALQQQKFSEAERHFEAALEAAENFPSGDARLGKSYNNLAAVYYAQEDFGRAEPLMRRALAQLRETLGPENTEVAQTMKNLAALYYLQGNRSEAEALLKQSLEILENVHGPNHAFVATVLSNLAGLYQSEDRYGDAEPLLTRSLRIWESLLGSDHPDVVRSRALLTEVRQAQDGNQPAGTARAAVNPRTSVPSSRNGANSIVQESRNSGSKAVNELAEAKTALEALTELSKIEAANARAEGVPVPALNPIDDVGNPGIDAALSIVNEEASEPSSTTIEQSGVAAEVQSGVATEERGDVAAEVQSDIAAEVQSDVAAEGEIATAVLDDEPENAQQDVAAATALLNEATSANDISFAVYLSTLWSIDEARRYWQSMLDVMPDVLEGKQIEIEEVVATGGADPFYRVLSMPYSSDPEAQAACDLIKSKLRTHDCAVVVRDSADSG